MLNKRASLSNVGCCKSLFRDDPDFRIPAKRKGFGVKSPDLLEIRIIALFAFLLSCTFSVVDELSENKLLEEGNRYA